MGRIQRGEVMSVIFITGATSGIGKATATKFLQHGHKVIACGRRAEKLAELQTQHGENIHTIMLDVRDNNAVMQAVKNLPAKFAEIDVLVNNAGLALGLQPAHEASMEHWEQMVDTNIKGLMYVTRAILPHMVKQGRGHIINIGSTAGSYAYKGGNVYGGTKAFVQQFSLNLRADMHGKNVRVTCIDPGLCAETEFSLVRFEGNQEKASNVYADTVPLTGADVAEAIYWCATLPPHVNINILEMMPTCQSFAGLSVAKIAAPS